MKHRHLFQLFACAVPMTSAFAASSGSGAASRPVTVFLLAGQSNLAGRGAASGLPAEYLAGLGSVRLDYVCSFGARADGVGAPDPHRSEGWGPLQPSPKHRSTPEGHFGPELGFAHVVASRNPSARLAIVKHGRGATSLAVDWDPDADSGPRHYRDFVAQARAAIDRLVRAGETVELGAFVWAQGEADSTRREWAEAYEGNLTKLIARVRSDFAAPDLPVLLVLTGDGKRDERMAHTGPVRAAQQALAKRDPRAAIVSGDDLTIFDTVHYDAPSQVALGERLGAAYLARFRP